MRLRRTAQAPPTFTSQYSKPGIILRQASVPIELPDRVPPLQLLEFDRPYLPAYPAIQVYELRSTPTQAEVTYPPDEQLVQELNL